MSSRSNPDIHSHSGATADVALMHSSSPIRTYSGRSFDFLAPEDYPYEIDEIATVLSRICRFGGHTQVHYSVAQHSVLVCELVRARGGSRELVRAALLHDAAEAYAHDIVSPLKRLLDDYKLIEARIERAIIRHFGLCADTLTHALPLEIKRADADVCYAEIRDVMNHGRDAEYWPDWTPEAIDARLVDDPILALRIVPLPAPAAKAVFLDTYSALEA